MVYLRAGDADSPGPLCPVSPGPWDREEMRAVFPVTTGGRVDYTSVLGVHTKWNLAYLCSSLQLI